MQMNEKTKNILSTVLRISLSFLLLGWLFQRIDFDRTVEVLKDADLTYIISSFLIFLFIMVLLFLRWLVLIKALSLEVRFMNVVRYYFIGLFCNLFFPSAIGGDVIKAYGLCRDSSQKARVVASVLLDRLSGFASIIIVATIVFVSGHRLLNEPSLLIMIFALAVLSFTVFSILFNERLYSFGCRIFNRVPRIKKSLMNLHYDVVLIKDKPRAILAVLGLSCLCQILLSVIFYLLAKGLHLNIGLIYFLFFSPMVCVASSLPSIGGLGVREVGWVYLLSKINVAEGISVSMSLMSYLFMVIVGLIGGLIYVSTISTRRIQYSQSDSAVSGQEA